jgi:hypothetical protein
MPHGLVGNTPQKRVSRAFKEILADPVAKQEFADFAAGFARHVTSLLGL